MFDENEERDMKTRMLATAALVSMMAVGSAFAMDSDTLQKNMQRIQENAESAERQAKIAALEQEVAELKELLRETIAAFQEANM